MDKVRKANHIVVLDEENGWGLPVYNGYLDFPRRDESGIVVLYQDHANTVMPHKHFYHELALVISGSAMHTYQGEDPVPLLPGDVLLIEPHVQHSYVVESPLVLVNCQFFTRKHNMDFNRMIGGKHRRVEMLYEEPLILQRWEELRRETDVFWQELTMQERSVERGENAVQMNHLSEHVENRRGRGIVTLGREDLEEAEHILYAMLDEQENPDRDSASMKSIMLQLLLTRLKRSVRKQNAISEINRVDTRSRKIEQILTYIEEHISENLQIGDLADQLYWSEGYFRNVFKEVTGFAPVQYINRKRIMISIDYIEKSKMNVQEAAERVGIYDPSYYSRLFKKHMGFSPRELSRMQKL